MGILYSHIVFQPPSPPTYGGDNGVMYYRKLRDSEDDTTRSVDAVASTNSEQVADSDTYVYIEHPLIFLNTSKGSTIPAAYFGYPNSYFTILFSHGNGEDLGVSSSYAHELSIALKTSVFVYDYAGYGIATSKATEANCYSDIRAAYTYLVSERRISPKRILLFGRSLGSGPTIDLAATLGAQLGGVVLIGGLTSCVRIVFQSVPSTLKFDMFANIDKIHRISVPVFCVHGMVDHVVPFEHGVELSQRAKYPLEPLWVRDAGHNNLESSRFQYEVFLRYLQVLQEFKRWKAPPGADASDAATPSGPRDSAGALRKVAGCFGPSRTRGENARESRRMKRTASLQHGFPRSLSSDDALRAVWKGHSQDGSRGSRVSDGSQSARRPSDYAAAMLLSEYEGDRQEPINLIKAASKLSLSRKPFPSSSTTSSAV